MFDEYILLDNQTDRLREVMDKINARPQPKQVYKPYIHNGGGCGHRIFPGYDRGYDTRKRKF